MLPLLVILFVVSYGILTLLVFEQGKTIESQRTLIREMLKDSTQLAVLKDKQARDDNKRNHDKVAVAPNESNIGSGTADAVKPPDTNGADTKPKRPGKSAQSLKQAPEKRPAADLEDVRRSTRLI
jgi:hypothetical protein